MTPPPHPSDAGWMRHALTLAERAAQAGDVPVGAVVVSGSGELLGEGWNQRERDGDPSAHAEVVAIRAAAARLGSWRLAGCALVVTMEPCPMCAGAAMLARVDRVVLGAWDPKLGACGSVWDVLRDRRATHRAEVVGGVLEQECGDVVRRFFDGHRPPR
ncbi:MAG TPA: tRNA adenosine(34) deaminase TadA [Ornithinibacter sp.]|nr:tRNA adenosine(34) deaminase TadA [Ornithinibacter sp.]HOB80448.1 tRNA adenosine(34) deaminase TadA [Ornithinibacter sp.]HPV89949.1 tRNA adenosine(34) deaminase TadA [Ornithinibacter sp.]